MITIMSMLFFMISLIMMILASTLSKKSLNDREKSSAFECGFDPKTNARIPFSIQFFLIAIIFLIFDVEITLLIPLVMTTKSTQMLWYMILTTTFLMILLLGTFHEWKQGALNWMN